MELAHYRLETKIFGRKAKDKSGRVISGRESSVVAKSAYRSGQSLKDERADKTFNYRSRAQEVAYSEIMVPENSPDWLKAEPSDNLAGTRKQRELRQTLWNAIERVEKRKDSQLAREFVASLPRVLTREQQIELIKGWCQDEFVSKGFVVDLAIHKSKNGKNPHAHIMVTTRPVTKDGFGKKPATAGKFNGRGSAGTGAKDDLVAWRKSYAEHENVALEKAGRPERVDHRSLKDRGIDREPEPKIGVAATAMKRRGLNLDPLRHQFVRYVKLVNEVRPYIRAIQRYGRTAAKRSRILWLEKSSRLMARFRGEASKTPQGNSWTMKLDSQRQSQKDGLEHSL